MRPFSWAGRPARTVRYTVINSRPQFGHLTTNLALTADMTVSPTSPSILDLRRTIVMAKVLKKRAVACRFLLKRVAMVGHVPTAEFTYAQAFLMTFERQVYEVWIPNRPGYARALARGKALQECIFGGLADYVEAATDENIEAARVEINQTVSRRNERTVTALLQQNVAPPADSLLLELNVTFVAKMVQTWPFGRASR